MARHPHATEQQAFAVLDRLSQEGVKITQSRLRQELGGGSATTIGRYVRNWLQASGQIPLPLTDNDTKLAGEIRELWNSLNTMREQQAIEAQARVNSDITDLTFALESAMTELAQVSQDKEILKLENATLATELRVLRERLTGWDDGRRTAILG